MIDTPWVIFYALLSNRVNVSILAEESIKLRELDPFTVSLPLKYELVMFNVLFEKSLNEAMEFCLYARL